MRVEAGCATERATVRGYALWSLLRSRGVDVPSRLVPIYRPPSRIRATRCLRAVSLRVWALSSTRVEASLRSAEERARLIATASLLLDVLKGVRSRQPPTADIDVVERWIARVAGVHANLDAITDWRSAEAYGVSALDIREPLLRLFPAEIDSDFEADVKRLERELLRDFRALQAEPPTPATTQDEGVVDVTDGARQCSIPLPRCARCRRVASRTPAVGHEHSRRSPCRGGAKGLPKGNRPRCLRRGRGVDRGGRTRAKQASVRTDTNHPRRIRVVQAPGLANRFRPNLSMILYDAMPTRSHEQRSQSPERRGCDGPGAQQVGGTVTPSSSWAVTACAHAGRTVCRVTPFFR
jgi:hypothetical protein